MKIIPVFLFEFKHFWRNPFKVLAVLLFIIAGVYGLHNGALLYKKQTSEIEKINLKSEEQKAEIITYFENGEKGPKNRPWINVTTPFWAIWNTPVYAYKKPSSAIVYSIGQAEQFGFYKQITFWASTYDTDMSNEISNPERLQIGTLDFSFVILFLLPLVLLILVYNLKASENEQGFLPLIELQTTEKNKWLFARFSFYTLLLLLIGILLICYGASLTNIISNDANAFKQIILLSFLYLLFWSILFFFISKQGKTIINNSLKMIGIWLVFCFIIPGTIHQYISIVNPANLMTSYIDSKREDRSALFNLPNDSLKAKLFDLYPEIVDSNLAKDSTKIVFAINQSSASLANDLVKKAIKPIELENQVKNTLLRNTFWFNPVIFFQNKFNRISQTQYDDYQKYREIIQSKIDKNIKTLVIDVWNNQQVDKKRYLEYYEILNE